MTGKLNEVWVVTEQRSRLYDPSPIAAFSTEKAALRFIERLEGDERTRVWLDCVPYEPSEVS